MTGVAKPWKVTAGLERVVSYESFISAIGSAIVRAKNGAIGGRVSVENINTYEYWVVEHLPGFEMKIRWRGAGGGNNQ